LIDLPQDLITVVTDRLHKNTFKQHAELLRAMFTYVESGQIAFPLTDAQHMDNRQLVREFIGQLLLSLFPHLSQ
jgi:hypothetical protein